MAKDFISFEIDDFIAAFDTIQTHYNRFNIEPSVELKKVFKEIADSSVKQKNLTQKRAALISIDVAAFYYNNNITMEENVKAIVSNINNELKDSTAIMFFNTAQEIRGILNTLPRRTFQGYELFFANDDEFNRVKSIQAKYESSLSSAGDKRLLGFKQILNIINSKEISHKYLVSYKPNSKQINSNASTGRYLESHYHSWVAQQKKDAEEFIKVHELDNVAKERVRRKLDATLLSAKEEHKYITDNFNNIDVRILTFEEEKLYPVINVTTAKHSNDFKLRSTVANLLWFTPLVSSAKMNIDEYISKAVNPYGSVYYIS